MADHQMVLMSNFGGGSSGGHPRYCKFIVGRVYGTL